MRPPAPRIGPPTQQVRRPIGIEFGDRPTMQRLNPYGYNLFSRAGTESVSTGERMPGTVLEKFLIGVFNPILV